MFNVSPFKGWHYLTTEVGGKSIIGSGKEHKVNIDEEFLKPFRWGTFENPWYMKEQLKKTRLSWVRKFINSTLFFSFAIFFDKYLLSFLLNNKVSSFVQVIKNKFIRTKSRGVSYKIKSKSLIDFINLYSISKKINSRNFRDFKNNSSFFDVEKEEDYVYIPLHYQPELTSCPLGGDFADQIFLIREVAKKIPKNFKIVVKEHSSQFHNGLQGYCGRHPGYYADIAKINNVVICAMDTPSIDLIRNCKFVVTVTGTAGWEAIVNGKVCICVGEAWYKYFPNVINAGVDDLKDKIELALSKEKFQEINGKYINDLFLKYSIKADLHNYFNGGIPRDAEIVKNHIAQALLQINCSYQKL